MDADSDRNAKIPLPKFLQLFTSNGVPVPKAMAIASKVYKDYNTPAALAQLKDATLSSLGIEGKDERNAVVSSLQKAGYIAKGTTSRKVVKTTPAAAGVSLLNTPKKASAFAGSSAAQSGTTHRKRKRSSPSSEFLAEEQTEELAVNSKFDFDEVTDKEVLSTKFIIINRAPVMMAWAMTIAERMNFSRAEALSIASVYTELNAISKGRSLGLYDKCRGPESEVDVGSSQPYVDLMGRRPLYRAKAGEWRALSNGKHVAPVDAFSYITRAFRQTTPYIIGALKLLAHSYSAEDLNDKAWSLYAEFRPEVNEWGKRSQVHCQTILELRKKAAIFQSTAEVSQKLQEQNELPTVNHPAYIAGLDEPIPKKPRPLTVEEYEAILDQDDSFYSVNLHFVNTSSPHATQS